MKITKLIALTLTVLSYTATQAQQVYSLSVADAVNLAFKNVISLKNLELDYKIQTQVNKQIEASAYPKISADAGLNKYLALPQFLFPDASATAIYSILKEEGVRDGTGQPIVKDVPVRFQKVSFQQPWNANAGITLNQLLFQPDVFVGLKARAAALDFGKMNIEVEKEKVREQAYKQYYAVLIAQQQLLYVTESITRVEKLKNDVEQLYKNGFREKLDIDKVQVPLNNLITTQNLLSNAIMLNLASLKFAIGVPQADSIILTDVLTPETLKRDLPNPATFNYNNRVEIQLLATARKLQTLDLQRQKLSNLPTLAGFINYQAQGQGQKFITNPNTFWLRTSLVGLQLSVPIFNGFLRKHKVNEAAYKLAKVDNSIAQIKQVIDLEQTLNKNIFTNALLNITIQERNLALANSIYNSTKKKYEQGLAASFELLQDQNNITDAQSKYFDALYQATVAKISYQRALGQLK